jgi:hypothetical protein
MAAVQISLRYGESLLVAIYNFILHIYAGEDKFEMRCSSKAGVIKRGYGSRELGSHHLGRGIWKLNRENSTMSMKWLLGCSILGLEV